MSATAVLPWWLPDMRTCCDVGRTSFNSVRLCARHQPALEGLAAERRLTLQQLLHVAVQRVDLDLLVTDVRKQLQLLQVLDRRALPRSLDWPGLLEERLQQHVLEVGPGTGLVLVGPPQSCSGRPPSSSAVEKAALGVTSQPARAPEALVWDLLGVDPDVAFWLHARVQELQEHAAHPVTAAEAEARQPIARPFLALRTAVAWQRQLLPGAPAADAQALAAPVDLLQARAPFELWPTSLDGLGMPQQQARALHGAVVRHGLALRSEATEDVLEQWRRAGFAAPDLLAWLGVPRTRREPRSRVGRDAFRHAELRHAGAVDLADAEGALLLWESVEHAPADEVLEMSRAGVPPEWAWAFFAATTA